MQVQQRKCAVGADEEFAREPLNPADDVFFPEPALRRRRWLKYGAVPAFLLLAALLGSRFFSRSQEPIYSQASVERGTIVKTISATGRLQPVVTVQIGSQVSGRIAELHADFNSRVKKGDVIARLDPSLFQAQLDQVNASLASAQASVQAAESAVQNAAASVAAAEANRERARAASLDAERAQQRAVELVPSGAISQRDVESAEAAAAQSRAQLQQASAQVDQAKAQLLSARSQVIQARAQVKQTQAARDQAAVNLSHTIIRAPIDGVVIGRDVDVGQTVAASFQSPTLFLLANDLTRMQVLADIDEADVGQLGPDSKVSFTVDAYPGDVFHGQVSQVRLNPQTVQNVVTYTAVVDVPNPEMKLKPGMTANVTAVVAEHAGVLHVPNAALRFQPETETAGPAAPGAGQRLVWKIEPDGTLRPVPVSTGLTDGVRSEVLSGNLKPGDLLATGQSTGQAAKSAPVRNPMMPMGRGGRR